MNSLEDLISSISDIIQNQHFHTAALISLGIITSYALYKRSRYEPPKQVDSDEYPTINRRAQNKEPKS